MCDVDVLLDEFEAAWQETLRGGERPSIAGFLSRASDHERPTVLNALQTMDARYQEAFRTLQRGVTLSFPGEHPTQPDEPQSSTSLRTYVAPPAALPGVTLDAAEGQRSAHETTAYPAGREGELGQRPAIAGYEIVNVLGRGGMGVV